MDWTAIGTMLSTVGLMLVAAQIRAANKIARADFMLRLESEFVTHHIETYQKLIPGGGWAADRCGPADGPANAEQVAKLEHFLDFFATLQVLRNAKLVEFREIDEMFGYRFFIAVNNPHTHKVIDKKRSYFQGVRSLHGDWIALRRHNKDEVPQPEYPFI